MAKHSKTYSWALWTTNSVRNKGENGKGMRLGKDQQTFNCTYNILFLK